MAGLDRDDVLLDWSHPWRRGRGVVDLHVSYYGINAPHEQAWKVLTARTRTVTVAGASVEVLEPGALALLTALHAAHHGGRAPRAMADLERAVRAGDRVWREAVEAARELDAVGGLTAGLTMTPAGAALADRLGIAADVAPEALLRRTETGEGFSRLSRAPGLRGKLSLARRELLPSAAFLRWQIPLARRGPAGLAAAYVWRWAWLARRAPAGYRAFRRMRSR
jgi:hypothetical protein